MKIRVVMTIDVPDDLSPRERDELKHLVEHTAPDYVAEVLGVTLGEDATLDSTEVEDAR